MSTRYDADSATMGFRSSDELAAWQRDQSRASLAKPQPVGGALPWTQKTALEKAPSIIMQLEVAAERFTRYSHDSIDGLLQEAADAIRALAKPGALPEGWVPLNITFEGGDPEEVAYGPQIMMDRLKKWLDKYYATLSAPVAQPATPQVPKAVRDFLFSEYNKDATTPKQIARQRRIGALLDSLDRKP